MNPNQTLPAAEDTLEYGRRLGDWLAPQALVYLHGELGAGKTTLVRGLLQGLGYRGEVASPTFTLVNHYELPGQTVIHLDLYRIETPEELEYLGIREWLEQATRRSPGQEPVICLIEWPERLSDQLPEPDFSIFLEYADHGRRIELRGT